MKWQEAFSRERDSISTTCNPFKTAVQMKGLYNKATDNGAQLMCSQ